MNQLLIQCLLSLSQPIKPIKIYVRYSPFFRGIRVAERIGILKRVLTQLARAKRDQEVKTHLLMIIRTLLVPPRQLLKKIHALAIRTLQLGIKWGRKRRKLNI